MRKDLEELYDSAATKEKNRKYEKYAYRKVNRLYKKKRKLEQDQKWIREIADEIAYALINDQIYVTKNYTGYTEDQVLYYYIAVFGWFNTENVRNTWSEHPTHTLNCKITKRGLKRLETWSNELSRKLLDINKKIKIEEEKADSILLKKKQKKERKKNV